MTERLNIGVATHRGSGKGADYVAIAKGLMKDCLKTVDESRLPVRGLLLLATADWCRPSDSLSRHVRLEFKTHLGYSVPLIGASMAMIYSSTDLHSLIEEGLILVAVCSNDFWMTVGVLPRPYDGTYENRHLRLCEMADRLEDSASFRLGTSAQRDLLGFLPGMFLDKEGQQVYFDNEFHREILKAFHHRYRFYGGAASDGIVPTKGYQFANDECLESGLALAMIESDLSTGGAIGHGFVVAREAPLSVDRLVGDAKTGYDVTMLDGTPASECLRNLAEEVLGKEEMMVFGIPCGPDFDVLVPLGTYKGEEGAIRLSRQVSRNDHIYLLTASLDHMIKADANLFELVQESADVTNILDLGFILSFSCTGRFELYRRQNTSWQEAIERVRTGYPGVPVIGGLCAGEFGVDAWHNSRSNNMSISLCCLSSKLCRRGRTRELQDALLLAGDSVANCDSPRKVMEAALKGAVDAGATGGQVCTVDWGIRRIIGKHLGFAYGMPGSGHNWPLAGGLTDRDIPVSPGASCCGDLPPALKEWAVWLKPPSPRSYPCNRRKSEDLLTLIVRCQVAVFVPDSRDPDFCCNQEAINGCVGPPPNTLAQLAVPLIGLSGKAIATLQVGFPSGTILDRESIKLWVGYARQVSAAIERAQEAEEKTIKEAITKAARLIRKVPVNTKLCWHEWCKQVCQPYVETVRKLLNADGAHMWVQHSGIDGNEATLVAGDGKLDYLRRYTRPVTQISSVSLNPEALGELGQITNTKEKTKELNAGICPLTGDEAYQQAFDRELNVIESTGQFPLFADSKLLGFFIIDSKQQYFFTERLARIARFATTEVACTMLQDRSTAYDRAIFEEEWNRIVEILTATTGLEADRALRTIIKYLCEATGANVGSVYIWNEILQRFVLHIAHNWHCECEMEGKAWYGLDEGWTGSHGLFNDNVVQIMDPSVEGVSTCTRKYYSKMVPKEHWAIEGESDARVGISLGGRTSLVGVVTLTYWRDNSEHLVKNRERIKRLAEALSPMITLAVQLTRHEIVRHEVENLIEAEKETAHIIIQAARPDGNWQTVVDVIREKFHVERVSFYHFDGGSLKYDRSSVLPGVVFRPPNDDPMEPIGPMREAVSGKSVTISSGNAHLFGQWPSLNDARGAFLVPVVCTVGDVRGVLEFVNRIQDRNHPFEVFDEYEQSAARDVARAMGAGLDHRNHEIAEGKLKARAMTAIKIGAASITSAIVMHELMAPFARIRQAVTWLQLNPEGTDDERRTRLGRIQIACTKAVETICQAASSKPLVARHESLRTIVKQSIGVIQSDLPVTGVRLELRDTINALVHVNMFSIVGAIVTLLSNAIDAIGISGSLVVSTEINPDAKMGIIRIRNDRPHVEPEQIAKFFRPGYTLKSREGHLGLGLSVAHQTIETAGGDLKLVPCPEGGVEAIVSLPLADNDKPGEKKPKEKKNESPRYTGCR